MGLKNLIQQYLWFSVLSALLSVIASQYAASNCKPLLVVVPETSNLLTFCTVIFIVIVCFVDSHIAMGVVVLLCCCLFAG